MIAAPPPRPACRRGRPVPAQTIAGGPSKDDPRRSVRSAPFAHALPTIEELAPLYAAIYARETSSGRDLRAGDDGRSRGPFQIGELHWTDSGIPVGYEPYVHEYAVCQIEMYLYWLRRCPEALAGRDLEMLARFHNGGPERWASAAAGEYWTEIEALMMQAMVERLLETE